MSVASNDTPTCWSAWYDIVYSCDESISTRICRTFEDSINSVYVDALRDAIRRRSLVGTDIGNLQKLLGRARGNYLRPRKMPIQNYFPVAVATLVDPRSIDLSLRIAIQNAFISTVEYAESELAKAFTWLRHHDSPPLDLLALKIAVYFAVTPELPSLASALHSGKFDSTKGLIREYFTSKERRIDFQRNLGPNDDNITVKIDLITGCACKWGLPVAVAFHSVPNALQDAVMDATTDMRASQ